MPMNKDNRLPRTVRGKRPQFFEAAGVDEVHSMLLVLAQELVVLRERIDAAEMIAAARGVDLAQEIEALELDEAALARREAWRKAFFDRLYYLTNQRRAELEKRYGEAEYEAVLDEVAAT